jgi:hypothetical protein
MLDEIQRGPLEARQWQAAPPEFRRLIPILRDPTSLVSREYQQILQESGLVAGPELETYLDELEAFVVNKVRLTDRGHVAWWAMDAVHRDVAGLGPGNWIDALDLWRVPDVFTAHVRVDIIASLYDARVICTDGQTGETLWEETLAPTTEEAFFAFTDWDAVYRAADRCTRGVESTMTRHHQDANLQRSRRPFVRTLTERLPTLVAWHFHNQIPTDDATLQSLRRLARNRLGIDPLAGKKPGKKKASKLAIFLPRKPENRGYGGDEA